MKTTRNIAVLILIALAGGTYAQLAYCAEGSTSPGEGNRRDWKDEEKYSLPEMNPSAATVAAVETEAALFEEELGIELWMTVPFEVESLEEQLVLETWMTEPFDKCLEEPELEAWMMIPFERPVKGDRVCMEDWMTEPFILHTEVKLANWLLAAFW